MSDIAAELAKLHVLKGADYSRQVERIAYMGDFHPVENELGTQEHGLALVPASLNFSKLDFDSINLAEDVENCLQKYGIDKKLIHIEVTESTLSYDDEKLKEILKKFRTNGYALWLDDFGAGYSGLNVLKEYDFDMMKIDMKFLSDFDTDDNSNEKAKTLLKNIVILAKELGMKTLSEGFRLQDVISWHAPLFKFSQPI